MVVGTGCEWAGCVSCLSLFVSQCFWLITLPSFPLSSCQTTQSFFLGGGGAGKAASPTPFHYQPTPLSPDGIRCPHICIVCQSRTPTPNPLFEQTRTHELTRINSHKLVLYYDLRIFGTPIAFDKHWISFVMSRSDMGDFFHTGTSVCEIIWQTVFFRTFVNLIRKKLSENTEMTAISK